MVKLTWGLDQDMVTLWACPGAVAAPNALADGPAAAPAIAAVLVVLTAIGMPFTDTVTWMLVDAGPIRLSCWDCVGMLMRLRVDKAWMSAACAPAASAMSWNMAVSSIRWRVRRARKYLLRPSLDLSATAALAADREAASPRG